MQQKRQQKQKINEIYQKVMNGEVTVPDANAAIDKINSKQIKIAANSNVDRCFTFDDKESCRQYFVNNGVEVFDFKHKTKAAE